MNRLSLQTLGGPTVLIEIGGLRLLTDPTFSAPGKYETAPGRFLTKTKGPALNPEDIGKIDAVLLSHDQHADNLDPAGREFIKHVPTLLTTVSGAERLNRSSKGLKNWEAMSLSRQNNKKLIITGVPARHGPDGAEQKAGEVTGFVLSGENLPTVYISGDNASLDIVRTIAQRIGNIDVVILFTGGAQTALLNGAYLTLTSKQSVEAAEILNSQYVVPVHYDGWLHFTEGAEQLQEAFSKAGMLKKFILKAHGTMIDLPLSTE